MPPGALAAGGAPDRNRTGLSLEGHEEGIDGDVVDAGELWFELLAVDAVRIAEDRDLALAIAAHGLDRVVQRQLVDRDGCCRHRLRLELSTLGSAALCDPGARDVAHAGRVEEAAEHEE